MDLRNEEQVALKAIADIEMLDGRILCQRATVDELKREYKNTVAALKRLLALQEYRLVLVAERDEANRNVRQIRRKARPSWWQRWRTKKV